MNILFICTGNTCRSPMAEALLKDKLPTVNVKSAGIYAREGDQANDLAIDVLIKKQIKINHSSQPVTEQLLSWADYVFTMTSEHKQALILRAPEYIKKYYTLKEFIFDPKQELWTKFKSVSEQIEKSKQSLIDSDLENALSEHLQPKLAKMYELQDGLRELDISDPFGGTLTTYAATLSELEKNIDQLIKQLEGRG